MVASHRAGTNGARILATDLDGTFAHGDPADRRRLTDILQDGWTLIYVTGRTLDAWQELAGDIPLPAPHLAITDVGTGVVYGNTLEPVGEVERHLDAWWPGHDAIRERLSGLKGIAEQDVDAPRRVGYEVVDRPLAPALRRVRTRLSDLPVDIVGSANRYIDILPRGVNKGTTLIRVLEWLNASPESTVVAGDSLNDLALFDTGLTGIIVGNAEPALRRRVARRSSVYRATAEGAGGILEGLKELNLIESDINGQ